MGETLDSALVARLRKVVASGSVTESDLRDLTGQADGWVRTLRWRIRSGERRLHTLNAKVDSPVSEIADELRRIEASRHELKEAYSLLASLEGRAHELRAEWLRRQSESARPGGV